MSWWLPGWASEGVRELRLSLLGERGRYAEALQKGTEVRRGGEREGQTESKEMCRRGEARRERTKLYGRAMKIRLAAYFGWIPGVMYFLEIISRVFSASCEESEQLEKINETALVNAHPLEHLRDLPLHDVLHPKTLTILR